MQPHTAGWPLLDRLFYPLPALIVLAPVAWLPQPVAAAIFVGVPSGALAWRLSEGGLWRLLALATPGYAMALCLGQWAPWFMLAMLVPWLGFVFPGKPTIGAACFAGRPSHRAFTAGLAIVAASLALSPSWPVRWLANLHDVVGHPAPIFTLAGCWLWLVVLRWYDRDGRLLLAFALVPQVLFFADQAPLSLLAETKGEAVTLTVCGWIAAACWYVRAYHTTGYLELAAPYVLVGCYLPALWLMLRRRRVSA
jgi:hypothetical protein